MDSPINITELFMLGLLQNPEVQKVLFVLFRHLPGLSWGNLLIIITIVFSPTLGSSMYFFLSYLSFTDTCYSSWMTPKLIANTLYEGGAISFEGCLAQFFVAHLLGRPEIILIIVMAYDHYVAGCKPLNYMTIMTNHL